MIFHDVKQNSNDWENLRLGLVTSSSLTKVMANFGKAFGEPAKKYAANIAIERITGEKAEDSISTFHMERGHREEPIARMLYEESYFCEVLNGGFFEDGRFGGSPDGLIGSDGIIEIKSQIPSVHFETISKKRYSSSYKWQIAGNIKASGRDWIDFISYCERFPEGKKLFVKRYYADEFIKEIAQINQRLDEFYALVDASTEIILNSEYLLI